MNPNLFKSAEFYQRRYHNFATLLIVPLMLLLGFLLIFAFLAKKEVTVTSQGEITPTKVIASIQSTSNNPIITNNLSNNQLIQKGDLIIQYSETMESSQKKALETHLETLNRQKTGIATLIDSLEQGTNLFTGEDEFGYIYTFNNFIKQFQDLELGISKVNTEVSNQATIAGNTVAAIDTQINNLNQQIAEYEELYQAIINKSDKLSDENPHQATLNNYLTQTQQNTDASLENQYVTQINQSITSIESSINSLNIQKASTGSVSTYDNSLGTKIEVLRTQFLQSASQQETTIDNQITELTTQLDQANIQLKNNKILASETGIVQLNNDFEGHNLIPSGSDIAQIYPDIADTKKVLITYYVTSDYVSLLKEDQPVRLSLEKVGNQNLTVIGKIQSIDKTATKTEQGNLFKIEALAQLSDKESKLVQYGLQGRVTTIIAKKTYFDYYKDKILNNF
ncbi:TPA: bacteriocin secretion accessory protein [Streptococcus suis]|nr:bacteriocin secretion accessory protein [Streptococcus suis]HEM5941409.1 bacteriocin secretion accessory protein [Streptococcus suis]HEM6055054.1 bacteriocin secretion accessory protein [Streptococcus suis]HEM6132572.1 bacteriocin secretion accessory protein [Streptococcus suis]HEM6149728.1 bacteriocin secretion accessory protein [Streptococcus suis]